MHWKTGKWDYILPGEEKGVDYSQKAVANFLTFVLDILFDLSK